VQIGDLVMAKSNQIGIVVKIIDDARFKEGVLHLKVHFFENNTTSWFNAPSLTLLSHIS